MRVPATCAAGPQEGRWVWCSVVHSVALCIRLNALGLLTKAIGLMTYAGVWAVLARRRSTNQANRIENS